MNHPLHRPKSIHQAPVYFRAVKLLTLAALFQSLIAPSPVLAAEKTHAKAASENLNTGFAAPPHNAKPRVYWWWLFNRVDKAGITRDLEQFKAKGISGVNLICTGGYAGVKPLLGVKYQSPEWWALFRYAVKEAKRLNIEFGFNLSAGGWTMEGPWVTPDNAMKKVVFANLNVEGPKKFSDKLPQPETVGDYYHDYCVQAIPHNGGAIDPKDIIDLTGKFQPDGRLNWDVPAGQWTILRTGYTLTGEFWSKWHAYPSIPQADTFQGGDGYEIDYLNPAAFDSHFEHLGDPILKAVHQAGGRLDYFWSDSWECGKLTWTQDFPNQFRKYRGYDLKPYLATLPGAINFTDYKATFTATAPTQTLSFVGTNRSGGDNTVFIDSVQVQSNGKSIAGSDFGFETPSVGAGNYQYAPTGGSWTFGGSSGNGSGIVANGSGFGNPNAPQGGQAAFVQGSGKMSQTLSGLTPGAIYTVTWAAEQRPGNAQTWDVALDGAVIANCKPRTGLTIINDDVSRRFRADFDRTIQDCVADNCYGRFADVCHQNGVIMGSESAGPNNIPPEDALKNLGRCDFPAGEFWVNGHYNASGGYNSDRGLRLNLKQTASAAHVYGLRQAQAESFTQQEPDRTHWSLGPAELKPYANDAFCEGINRIMLHQATCQPPSDGKPGYEFCAGQHWNPNSTWWEQSPAFFSYLSRCSYLLQRGNFAADVCFYLGEEPPTLAPPKYVVPDLGSGYDCDYSNAEVLLKRMSVKNGRIVLPDGMNYRLLVLQNCVSPVPEIAQRVGGYQSLAVSSTPSKAMSVEVIQKLRQLVLGGATIVGAPPEEAAGLKNYPNCDTEVRKIAAELWGDLDGKTRTERRFGKGRVIWGKTPREILLADGVQPDCTFSGQTERPDDLDYIHRTAGNSEIYFVINRTNQPTTRDFTFRVVGRQPEIFDPVSGITRPATAFRQAGGRTTLPLEFDRFGSYFVVFRKPIAKNSLGKSERNFPKLVKLQNLAAPWNVGFDPAWAGPAHAAFPELVSWTHRPEEGIKFYSGKATYHQTFDLSEAPNHKKRMFLDLGDVRNVAVVRLNGKKLGILWCFPWRVEITGAVRAKGNVLEVDVINLWANRVIGDLNKPKEQRVTKTHDAFRFDMLTKNTPPLDAGLLGPVSVLKEQSLDLGGTQ
ncbi:MAG: hypothetical protein JWQ02_333 [Capsulimonas sp.]|nr:hypothetical protein [Capsulimonas sp.]